MIQSTPKLTKSGESLLMRAIAGESITFTRFKAGDGYLPEGQDGTELTDLVSEVLDFDITDTDDSRTGLVAITGGFDSGDVEEDFYFRELGIFARGEDNAEVLYAYANDGSGAGLLRAISTQTVTEQKVTMIVTVGDAENINVVYTPEDMTVFGTYTGDGTVKKLISLGFTPRCVQLCTSRGESVSETGGVCGGIAITGNGIRSLDSTSIADASVWSDDHTALMITTNGFYVNYKSGSIGTNVSGEGYRYIAYR